MPNTNYSEPNVFKTVKEKTVKKEAEETLSVWKPVAGKRFRLAFFDITTSVEAVLTIEDGSTVIYMSTLLAKTPRLMTFVNGGIPSAALNNELKIKVSAEGVVTGTFAGSEE